MPCLTSCCCPCDLCGLGDSHFKHVLNKNAACRPPLTWDHKRAHHPPTIPRHLVCLVAPASGAPERRRDDAVDASRDAETEGRCVRAPLALGERGDAEGAARCVREPGERGEAAVPRRRLSRAVVAGRRHWLGLEPAERDRKQRKQRKQA